MIVERPLAANVGNPNAPLVWFPNPAGPPVLEHGIEEELALVPVEATGHAAGLTDAPYHPLEAEACVCVYAKLQM